MAALTQVCGCGRSTSCCRVQADGPVRAGMLGTSVAVGELLAGVLLGLLILPVVIFAILRGH